MSLEQQETRTATLVVKREETITELVGGVFLVGSVVCANPQAARAALRASFPSLFPPGPAPGSRKKRAKKTATVTPVEVPLVDDQDRR